MRVTLAIVAASAAALAAPGALELDRARPLELWRIWTAHLAHFSLSHFALDAGSFLVLGILCERRLGPRRWAALLAVAAAVVSAGVRMIEPFDTYRGLSGLNYAALACAFALERRWGIALLGALAAKLLFEAATGDVVFFWMVEDGWTAARSAHALGALVGIAAVYSISCGRISPALPRSTA